MTAIVVAIASLLFLYLMDLAVGALNVIAVNLRAIADHLNSIDDKLDRVQKHERR